MITASSRAYQWQLGSLQTIIERRKEKKRYIYRIAVTAVRAALYHHASLLTRYIRACLGDLDIPVVIQYCLSFV